MVSAWYGGPGPGLVALVLGAVGADYFLPNPTHVLAANDPSDNIRLIFFVGTSLAIVALVRRQERTQEHQARQNEVLEREVVERQRAQKELEGAHQQLQDFTAALR
jgi:K+-sensing histidine kinase KdpD